VHDRMIVEPPRRQLRATPHAITRSGFSLGEHNGQGLWESLDYDVNRLVEFAIVGVID